ncbi:DUF4232 domain-containing protein [Nocardia sp. NPDC059240]|uniref:DUF4232 domain-containing protein n=1 Tax=Nocardia sp. NPDC059240 TaxID=3346786 RepID=UPI00369D3069
MGARGVRVVPVAAVIVALAAGCSGGASSSGGAGTQAGGTSAGPVTTVPGPTGTQANSSSVAPTTTVPVGVSGCKTAELGVALGRGDGAAGSTYVPIVFTNNGSRACSLTGYPGVSYTQGANGEPVGPAATREAFEGNDGGVAVVIAAGGRAAATLRTVNDVGVYPADTCGPVAVAGLRIYPPDNTESVFIPMARQTCTKIGILTIRAVAAYNG